MAYPNGEATLFRADFVYYINLFMIDANRRRPHVTTPHSATAPERLHALDAVRGFALVGGLVFHGALAFIPGPQVWLMMDSSRSLAIALLAFVLHMFRMITFFLIAGFFARLLVERDGTGGFIRNRLKRIGLPLIVFWPIVISAIVAVLAWSWSLTNPGVPPPPPPAGEFPAFPLTHLWFLYALLLLYAAALPLRAIVHAIDGQGRMRTGIDRIVALAARSPAAPFLLALPLTAALTAQESWPMWFGIPTPDQSLVPNLPATIGFSTAFVLGWLLHRQRDLLQLWAKSWLVAMAIALAATVTALVLLGPAETTRLPSGDAASLAYYFAYSVGAFAWTIGGIGLALKTMKAHSRFRRYVADASYWVYIVHLPVVLALQTALMSVELHWAIKFPLLMALTFALCFGSYHLLVRRSFIGQWLNGRRHRRGGTQVAAAAAQA